MTRGVAILLALTLPGASVVLAQEASPTPTESGTSVAVEPIAQRVARIVAAASATEIERTIRDLCAFGTRHVLSRTDSETEGTGAARRYLAARFEELAVQSGGRLIVSQQTGKVPVARQGMPLEIEIQNVIATLPGTTDEKRVYVVGGHYDTRNSDGADGVRTAPGANDDGSGTAVALEVCRLLCKERFVATIVFCAFDGEEQGLVGSKYCAQAMSEAKAEIDGMIGCDIVGNTLGMDGVRRREVVRCFSYALDGNDSVGRSMARALTYTASAHGLSPSVQLVFRGDRYGRGGDHRSFFEAGFPAVRLTEPREDYSRQHQDLVDRDGAPYGDVPEFVDFDYTKGIASLVAATLCELASAPPPPRIRSISASRTAYDTDVEFDVPASAAGFEFVVRATTAPDWESALEQERVAARGDENGRRRALLRSVALDDLVVGLRSVGRDGARSRAATPPDPDRMQRGRNR
ncbi:MAG: M20/M25/M40 family metallo-hydrolase [Planctomycetota bacterium]